MLVSPRKPEYTASTPMTPSCKQGNIVRLANEIPFFLETGDRRSAI
jgi:hypothetical protein